MKSLGKLNSDQFALAMYLINQKMKGIDPPSQLAPEMIPPSMRSSTDTAAFGITVSNIIQIVHGTEGHSGAALASKK